ncbi:MAG: hypothetical protein KY446_09655 [Proteobacteria bacterium]|nr:hypothetical protein [Pseudomonadota bacterium]
MGVLEEGLEDVVIGGQGVDGRARAVGLARGAAVRGAAVRDAVVRRPAEMAPAVDEASGEDANAFSVGVQQLALG